MFTAEGDIVIKAQRHMITTRRLSFDNCPEQMVAETISKYAEGPDAYNRYMDRQEQELYIEAEIESRRRTDLEVLR